MRVNGDVGKRAFICTDLSAQHVQLVGLQIGVSEQVFSCVLAEGHCVVHIVQVPPTHTVCHWRDVTAAECDHTLHDCIAVGILSHGTRDGQVYGVDGELVDVAVMLAPLKRCASLVGKPKIIVIEV